MSNIQYSLDALNAINMFYRVEVMVYVEGEDDVAFWGEIFEKLSKMKVELQSVGCSSELEKYIDEITGGTLNAIAARDSDYLDFLDNKHSHPRVIYTYGHSIENSLHTADCIYQMCKVSLRGNKVSSASCKDWLRTFTSAFDHLLMLEIANELEGAGIEVLGKNCSRFMETEDSDIVSNCKIHAQIKKVSARLKDESINAATAIKPTTHENILRWLRGHILESGIQKFIANRQKEYGRKVCLPYEQLFTNAVHQFQSSFMNGHPHYNHYEQAIKSADGTFC